MTLRRLGRLRASLAALGLGLGGAAVFAGTARSADQRDSPSTAARPSADLGDLYAWMQDGRLVVALTVNPAAAPDAGFDPGVAYVVHTASAAAYDGGVPAGGTDLVATFDPGTPQALSLWIGGRQVLSGVASVTSGLSSPDGRVVAFAGLRAEPSALNVAGLDRGLAQLGAVAPVDGGCPSLSPSARAAIVAAFAQGADGGPPSDALAGTSTLAIVVSLDPSLVTGGGPLVALWGATYAIGAADAGGQ